MLRELRFVVRGWRRRPGAIFIALLSLATAVAAATAVFSIVSGVLLRPLPYRDPERLVMVWQDMRARGGQERDWISPGLFVEWQQRVTLLDHLAAIRGWQPTLTGEDEPERLRGAAVSHTYFEALGATAALGRTLSAEDDRPGSAAVVVLGHGLWLRRFGGDAGVLNRTILLDGQPSTVIGVMPPSFRPAIVEAEAWSPIRINPAAAPRGLVVLRVLARLRSPATLAQAREEMNRIATDLAAEDAEWERARTSLVPLHEDMVGAVRLPLIVLAAAVGAVILIASANLANLLLAQTIERGREMTVRTAIGASRWQILRPLLAETLLLGMVAVAAGEMLGWWALRALVAIAPASAPRLQDVEIDGVLLTAVGAGAVAVTALAGLAPAAVVRRLALGSALRVGGREAGGSGRLRSALVIFEVALAMILVVVATLLSRTLIAMQSVDLGFEPAGVLSASLQPSRGTYGDPASVRELLTSILARAREIPGVEGAAFVSMLPLSGGEIRIDFLIPGRPGGSGPGESPVAAMRFVSPGYFRTMRMRLVKGRELTDQDHARAPAAVVVNEALARQYWPGEDPVGRKVDVDMTDATIVGVVADVHHTGPAGSAGAEMYLPYTQFITRGGWLVLRTSGSPAALSPSLRQVVRQVDANLPLSSIAPMSQLLDRTISQARFLATLLGGFAALAVLLTLFGIYSVLSFSVSRRTREIGVRIAVGAGHRTVLAMILRQSVSIVMVGIAAGVMLAAAVARLIRTLLFGVGPADAASYIGMAALITAAALVASYVPARRAARVDPLVALRED